MAGRTNMKDKKLEEAIDYVCSRCPYIFSDSTEWDKSNPAFADWRDGESLCSLKTRRSAAGQSTE